jgi:hypothetical protein
LRLWYKEIYLHVCDPIQLFSGDIQTRSLAAQVHEYKTHKVSLLSSSDFNFKKN